MLSMRGQTVDIGTAAYKIPEVRAKAEDLARAQLAAWFDSEGRGSELVGERAEQWEEIPIHDGYEDENGNWHSLDKVIGTAWRFTVEQGHLPSSLIMEPTC